MKNKLWFLICIVFWGCASKEEKIKNYCNAEGAYAKGYQAGKSSFALSANALAFCPEGKQKFFPQYKEGYLAGQKNREIEPTDSSFGDSPNVSLPRKCILRFRGDSFLGEGYSFGEAQQNALEKCKRQHGNSCHPICENL